MKLQPANAFQLVVEGHAHPIGEGLTAGKSLDNDVLVAGEDVLDFHLRVQPVPRGLTVFP